jgi:Family of unknown function (DUF695)
MLMGNSKRCIRLSALVEDMLNRLFGKKQQESPPDGRWTVAQGEDDGLPLIFRIRNKKPHGIKPNAYPHLIAISWLYQSINDFRMPSPEVSALMMQFEELLEPVLEKSQSAFLTVIVTGNGRREWQWYSRSPEETMGFVNQVLMDREPFPVEFSMQEDPQWEAYRHFQGICRDGRREVGLKNETQHF